MPRLRNRPASDLAIIKNYSGKSATWMPMRRGGNIRMIAAVFLADLQDDWEKHGSSIFAVVREQFPELYFQAMVNLAKVNRVEVGDAGSFDKPRTREEVFERVEQRSGPAGRKLLEGFFAKLEKLEQAAEPVIGDGEPS